MKPAMSADDGDPAFTARFALDAHGTWVAQE
jgi:hypothetical protein